MNELKNVNEALSKHKRNADDFRKFQEVRNMLRIFSLSAVFDALGSHSPRSTNLLLF